MCCASRVVTDQAEVAGLLRDKFGTVFGANTDGSGAKTLFGTRHTDGGLALTATKTKLTVAAFHFLEPIAQCVALFEAEV